MEDSGSIAWAIATVLGPVILGLAILYGWLRWRKRSRNPELEAARKRRVHEIYHKHG